ncbi:mechanosensitive ion channel family protein [Paracoccus alkanivorans]|nr:mechanosensitive ion channel family protein [Paracoccus alkanivorans]
MRSFLRAIDQIGAGSMDQFGTAASLIVSTRESRGERINRPDYAHLLFRVIDRLTFRLWELPNSPQGDRVIATLAQAGTQETFELAFQYIDGAWFIDPPPVPELEKTLERLRTARDEAEDTVTPSPQELRTPRDTFKTFLLGMQNFGSEPDNPAFATLDTSGMTEVVRRQEAPLLAGYILQVLHRIGYVYWQEIPDDPDSRIPYVHFQHPEGDIVVAPVETENGVIWQFTPDTLASIRAVYAAVDDLPMPPDIETVMQPDVFFQMRGFVRATLPSLLNRAGPLEQWQWVAAFAALIAGSGLGIWVSRIVFRIFGQKTANIEEEGYPQADFIREIVKWSIRAVVLGITMLVVLYNLGLPDVVATVAASTAWSLVVFGCVPIAWQGIAAAVDSYGRNRRLPAHQITLLSFLSGLVRMGIIVFAVLVLAELLGLPYQGVIAGLGIGGLAIALAAQPTLQNFLAGFTLFADRPLEVGDFCRFGDMIGTIEHIGMRSTRIRSPDRTVITVPNSDFANMKLENFSKRDRIHLNTTLQLRYETTPDQLRFVLAELRKLMIAHPKVAADPLRVRFIGFGAHSLDIEIYTYLLTSDYGESRAIQEDLFLRIMTVVEGAGAQFAFPSAVHYQAQDVAPDAERVHQAEQAISAWRKENHLPFPDYAWQEKAELSNSLDYPPEGSAVAEEMQPLPFEKAQKS